MATARREDSLDDAAAMRARLTDAEELLRAIRYGEVDALVVQGRAGDQVFTLQSTEEPYRALVEEMHEGAVVLSSRGDILYSNAHFGALVGEPLEAVIGSRIERFLEASERGKFESFLRSGGGRWRSTIIGSGSGAFDVSLSLTTASSTGDRRLNLIVTDLTELLEAKSSRARAEHDSRTKDRFLTMLAHELRTPLGAVSNAVAVLELTHASGQAALHAHDVIQRQVGLISRLIDDLLDVERVVSGKFRLQRMHLDLAETARDAVAAFAHPKLDRQIEISTEPVWVDGDAARLQQLLTNIVGNAVKYTPPGAHIRVDVRAERGEAVISVADEGFGISAELLPHVFDLYVQADRTAAHARGGLGIGLSLVHRLVELHGGRVEAASDGEGRGSTFVVRLPQVASRARSPSAPVAPERRSRRVLVIEDSADARETLRMALERAGHEVYDVADGQLALDLLSVVRPDVGIIGIGLPSMDGYDVARRIRAQPDGRSVLLLALVGDAGAAAHSSDRSFDHQLAKPVDLGHLTRLVSGGAQTS